jgi:hypothetical protein
MSLERKDGVDDDRDPNGNHHDGLALHSALMIDVSEYLINRGA